MLDPGRMRALGFCVSKEHARYMARKFTEAGLREHRADRRRLARRARRRRSTTCRRGRAALRLLRRGARRGRRRARRRLPSCCCGRRRRRRCSRSSSVAGCGVREGKSHLTVIDLIGQQHREFRFEDRLQAILDPRRGTDRRPGRSTTSRSCRPAAPSTSTARARRSSSTTCGRRSGARAGRRSSPTCERSRTASRSPSSSSEHDHRLEDVYSSSRCWTQLRRDAGRTTPAPSTPTSSGGRCGRWVG